MLIIDSEMWWLDGQVVYTMPGYCPIHDPFKMFTFISASKEMRVTTITDKMP